MRLFVLWGSLVYMSALASANAGWKPLPLQRNQATKQLQPRKIALVIGINSTQARYWTPLLYANRDAIRMAEALRGVARFDQIVLRVRRFDTSKAALWKAVKQLRARVKSPLDTVFVYVSAHGTVALNPKSKQQERYIVTSDTNQNTDKSAINVKRFVRELKRLVSKRVVLMLATCYTGSPRSKSRTKPGRKGVVVKNIKPLKIKALQILSASGFGQAAFESTKLRSDVYTHFFLDCLRKLKRKRANVSAIDVHACATKPTARFVKRHRNEIQVPRVDSRPGANRDVQLYTSKRLTPNVGYFWAGRKSRHVRYQLTRQALSKGQASDVYWANPGEYIGVRPGLYTVVVRNSFGWPIRLHTINVRRHGLTQLRSENLSTPKERLRAMKSSRFFFLAICYSASVTALLGGGVAIAYGAASGDKLPLYTGAIIGSIGVVWMLVTVLADVGTHSEVRRLQMEAEINPHGDIPQHGQFLSGARNPLPTGATTLLSTLQ